jgi:hypothetical protein
MSTYTTSIKLLAATETDYMQLSRELKKNAFHPVGKPAFSNSDSRTHSFVFNTASKKSLLDATTAVSLAAANTGKKYSFTVIKDKPGGE